MTGLMNMHQETAEVEEAGYGLIKHKILRK